MDGVVCGHIHQPAFRREGDFVYCNDGDWVEHCTALVERLDGTLSLIHWADLKYSFSGDGEQMSLDHRDEIDNREAG